MAITQEDCISAHRAEKKRKIPTGPFSVQPPRYRLVQNTATRAPPRNNESGSWVGPRSFFLFLFPFFPCGLAHGLPPSPLFLPFLARPTSCSPWLKTARCRCLTGCPPRDIPKVVSFGLRDAEIRNSKVQGTQSLDRFGPQDA
jgi:hypothetical protein